MTTTAEAAYQERTDLAEHGDNARLLFALQLRIDIDDIDTVASNAIVDGADDKGCDLVYVDRSRGTVIVAQGYESQRPREAAPANKADSLNTAATWLFARDIADVPERLQSVAWEVRSAIGDNEIQTVEFWFVHNVGESENVRQSMKTVQEGVRRILESEFGADVLPDQIVGLEVGPDTQNEWYESLAVHILVADEEKIDHAGLFEIEGDGWDAVVTAVRADWLRDLYQKHREKLFSANYREYLGTRNKRRRNEINLGIQTTASEQPEHLWVFNNGVSAIVSGFEIEKGADDSEPKLTIRGLSIVNGAQTTGAIGTLSRPPQESALVPIRFIRCSDNNTIAEIVRFNNSQNPLVPADYKSNDAIQRRLRDEFQQIPNCEYSGGRRGVDRIRTQTNMICSETCGQALAAFHSQPDVAYHNKAGIWRDDEIYKQFFCPHTTAPHVLFAFSLLKSIELRKKQLRTKSDGRTTQENDQFGFLTERGAQYLLVAAIASSLETVLGKKIASRFKISFGSNTNPDSATSYWGPIVATLIPFCKQLSIGVRSGVKDRDSIAAAITNFCQVVESVREANASTFTTFAGHVVEP